MVSIPGTYVASFFKVKSHTQMEGPNKKLRSQTKTGGVKRKMEDPNKRWGGTNWLVLVVFFFKNK